MKRENRKEPSDTLTDGGRIGVETEPGKFTEFIITLPRDDRTAAGDMPE